MIFILLNKIIFKQVAKVLIIVLFTFGSCSAFKQKTIIEGTTVNNNKTGIWLGVDITRYTSTVLIYRNNSLTSINTDGYMLKGGDESPGFKNNKLDNEVITGNQFTWNGNDSTSLTHGIFTGFNRNVIIKYNYLRNVPMSIIRKSNGMTNTAGGVAYNIVIDPRVAVVVKGMNGVNIFNNTFYSAKTTSQTWRGLVDIYTNTDHGLNAPSRDVKVFNNIFYTKHRILNIYIYEDACLSGFESDYNIFWCEDGEPLFKIDTTVKTFTEWQDMGYDKHSIVINPNFINFTSLVPHSRLDFGTNLGQKWQTGLSINAVWGRTNPDTIKQNGKWQSGAYVFKENSGK